MSTIELRDTVDAIFGVLGEMFGNFRKIDGSNVVSVIVKTMELVNGYDLSGPDKKDIVMVVVERVLEVLPMESEAKAALRVAVRLILPNLIDVVISAARHVFDLDKDGHISKDEVKEVCCGCF